MLPNVEEPESPKIGIWGEQRRKYLQTRQKTLYTAMLLGDTLTTHLVEVDKSASEMFDRLMAQLKNRDGITEKLKAADQLKWVLRMNTMRHEANNAVFNLCCRLCSAYEHKAFLDGLQYGAHLMSELFKEEA